jgi:hypothetical protein
MTENQIEITPEMIEAGLNRLYEFHITEPDSDEMRDAVAAVFRAMTAASECRSTTSGVRRFSS